MTHLLSIQFEPKLGDKQANLNKITEIISKNSKPADLIILPEFFSTGIHHESMVNSPEDENGGEVIEILSNIAKEYKTNIIAGSVIEKSENHLYNTSFALDRNGKIIDKYRKIHLFNYFGGTEGERITAGNQTKVINFDFAPVGLSICFDIRYPLHFRQLIEAGAELIVCPTAWCALHEEKQRQISLWRSFNIARASENLVYFMSSNGTGEINDFITNTGNSLIVSPYGEILADAEERECSISAEVDFSIVKQLHQDINL